MKYRMGQIGSFLRENFQNDIGPHLYAVVGTYALLEQFELQVLSDPTWLPGEVSLSALNVNRALLDRIGDEDLRRLVRSEGKHPQAIQDRLNQEFDALLADMLSRRRFLALKQLELLFAYQLDFQAIRARAANQSHILLLLPGELRGGHVALFAESDPRFHRELPQQLIADNHLWEIENA